MFPIHPLGKHAKILLSSVFGPYAQDDDFGSRTINPMELYHNQVTRFQGVFSLRMFHRSFGLLLMQANIDAPCTLLDFPTRERFIAELQQATYDIVGISGIIPNIRKVAEMCRLVRLHQPKATIVVGGHVTNAVDVETIVDADHFVKGDGVAWFRRFLGQDPKAPVRHPAVYSGFGMRILGYSPAEKPMDTAAILMPSVGCPVGCNFCSTSALFGGKGHFINFYETGDALFDVMQQIEGKLGVQSFFVLDENFLLHRKRALRLLELMQQHGKSWSLYVFSSARVLESYDIEQLVGLGVSWVWMGLEGDNAAYPKLRHVDTRSLVKKLQSHGIRVLGSTIIGLEEHRPEDMQAVIDYAVSHATDFHQFMLYTPNPGTQLYEKHKAEGSLLTSDEIDIADTHGQYRFSFRHPHIPAGWETKFLADAFQRDFEVNGPSLARLIRTQMEGWKRYRNHPDARIRRRIAWENRSMATTYAGAVWAMQRWFGRLGKPLPMLDSLLSEMKASFGWQARVLAPVVGMRLLVSMRAEDRRLREGKTYEPTTFLEKNPAAVALEQAHAVKSKVGTEIRRAIPVVTPAMA
ncbi:MAG: radical SAM protein [Thermodesulfobacteriota bacterium]